MCAGIINTINKVNTKIDTVAKSLEADNFGLGAILDSSSQDLALKDVKDLQKNLGNKFNILIIVFILSSLLQLRTYNQNILLNFFH